MISSLAQLSFSDTTGIGLSGIGYALFGFLFIKGKTKEDYKNYLDNKTINLFLFWLVLCVVLTGSGAWTVGNAAHTGGLLWGATIAYIAKFDKYIRWSIGFSYVAALVILIARSPFSTAYLSHQAYELHKNQKVNEAIEIYRLILKREPYSEFAKENLKQLELHQLEEKALDLHTNQQYGEARQLYNQILDIDKENQWAKENLKRLPPE